MHVGCQTEVITACTANSMRRRSSSGIADNRTYASCLGGPDGTPSLIDCSFCTPTLITSGGLALPADTIGR